MKTISVEEAADALNQYARGEATEPSVVMVEGRPVAALVPLDELDIESLVLRNNADFLALLEQSWREAQENGGISTEEMRRRLGLGR